MAKLLRGKVKKGYTFFRAKGNAPIGGGTVINDMTEEEYGTQRWKIDLLDGSAPTKKEVPVKEETPVAEDVEKEVEESEEESEEEEEKTSDDDEEPEAETKDDQPAKNRAVKSARRKKNK